MHANTEMAPSKSYNYRMMSLQVKKYCLNYAYAYRLLLMSDLGEDVV